MRSDLQPPPGDADDRGTLLPPVRPRRFSHMANPPLTPLIDVFLFLIIFFLLSCQFHQYEGSIPANLPAIPSAGGSGTMKVDPIRITLSPAGQGGSGVVIRAGETPHAMDDMTALFEYLRNAREHFGSSDADKLPVVIRPLAGVQWGFVVDAFNQAVRAGFKEVAVAPSGGAA